MEEFIAKYTLVKTIQAKFINIQTAENLNSSSKKQASIHCDKIQDSCQQSFENNKSLMQIPDQFQDLQTEAIHSNTKEFNSNMNEEYKTQKSLMTSTKIKNLSQCYQLIPDQCTSCTTLISKEDSIGPFVSANQDQNNDSIELQSLNTIKEVGKNRIVSKKNFLEDTCDEDSKKQKVDRGLHTKTDTNTLTSNSLQIDRFNKMNESNQVYSGIKQDPYIIPTSHHSVISRNDKLHVKCDETNHGEQIAIAEDRHRKCCRKYMLPIAYIGRSFIHHKLKDESNISNESKIIFEQLAELDLKGEGAIMHLPSIVGILCQRIVDLEDELLP